MWIVIPPVVSCVVANAAFFSFFVYAMYLQVDLALQAMSKKEAHFLQLESDEGVENTVKNLINADPDEACEGEPNASTADSNAVLADSDYETFIEMIAEDIFELQDMIDAVCETWSSLVSLFILIAFAELLAVLYDFILVFQGSATYEMTIWVYCIDTFLLVSGLGIMTGFLVLGAVLTQRMDELCVECVQVMRAANVPISKAACTFSYLQTGGRRTGLGFKIYGNRIEWSHVFGFLSIVLTIIGFVLNTPSAGQPAREAVSRHFGGHHR